MKRYRRRTEKQITYYPCRPFRVRKRIQRSPDWCIALPRLGAVGTAVYVLKRLPFTVLGAVIVFNLAIVIFGLGTGIIFSIVNPPVTALMIERCVDKHIPPRPVEYIPLRDLPESVPRMFLRLEDKRFYTHWGVDPVAIEHAYVKNKQWGRVVLGGSTITQQTVRTLFLTQDKNYLRKYVEAVTSIALDTVMDKNRIMELYLNYIEWGKGVYGIGAAARYHYHKPVSALTYERLSRLAVIIINPISYDVNTLFKHHGMALRYRVLNTPAEEAAAEEKAVGKTQNGETPASIKPETGEKQDPQPTEIKESPPADQIDRGGEREGVETATPSALPPEASGTE